LVAGGIVLVAAGIGMGVGAADGHPAPHHAPPPPAVMHTTPALGPIADTVMTNDGYGEPQADRGDAPTTPRSGHSNCSDGPWSAEDQDCAFGRRFPGNRSLAWDLTPGTQMYDSIADASANFPQLVTALDHGPFQKVPGMGSVSDVMPLYGAPTSISATDTTKVSGASLITRDRNIVITVNFWCQTYSNSPQNVDCLTYQQARKVAIDIVDAVLAKLPYKS
jgi:hypothetical protein